MKNCTCNHNHHNNHCCCDTKKTTEKKCCDNHQEEHIEHSGEEPSHCCCGNHNHNELNVDIKCNCGNCEDEEKEENETLNKILLIISAVITFSILTIEFIFEINPIISGVACGIATILVGYETFIKGFKSLIKLKINETTLMTIAVIAAFCLGEFTEGSLVTLLFSFGELMEDIAVNRSRKSIGKLAEIRPDSAHLVTENGEVDTPAEKVPVGSTIIIKAYERIPLDGIIIDGNTNLDTSAITGESIPTEATVNSSVMSGMKNGQGIIKVKTTKTADNSAASRILKMVEDSQKNKGNSEKFITRFAKIYTPIVMVIAVLVAVVPTLLGGEFSTWLYRALVCLVASCPCAVVISVPLAYFAGIGGGSKKGIMIKGGKYIETLAKSDCFVFDKTGTLTNGKITVSKITKYGELDTDEILSYCATAEKHSEHPIAKAIMSKAKTENTEVFDGENYTEEAGYGIRATVNGKEITVGSIKLLSDADKEKVRDNNSVFLIVEGKLQGGITIDDTIRSETKEVLRSLKSIGAKDLVMLTGDNKEKAEAVAKETGITTIYSNLLPEEKVTYMEEIRKKYKSTVFVGDGINDAPVIALADCGVAMGLGSDAAIEASDAVLSDGTLKQLPTMKKISRRIMNTIKTDITLSLLVKAAVIVLAIMGIAPMWLGVLSDTGLTMVCVLYSMRLLKA